MRHSIRPADAAALGERFTLSGDQLGLWLMRGAITGAALTAAFPLSASSEGWLRLLLALGIAMGGNWLALRIMRGWLGVRADLMPPPPVSGLEPGPRRLSLSLESVREVTDQGERAFRWRAFTGRTETADHILMRVSDRECLVLPKSLLASRGLAEGETLMALMGRGGR